MAFQEIPLDILHAIIKLIPRIDTYTLRNCAMASSRLLQPSQQALFEVVTLSHELFRDVHPSRLSESLLHTLKSSPRPLNQYIKSLVLQDGDRERWLMADHNIPLILSLCTNLVDFSLGGSLFDKDSFSEELMTSLEELAFCKITTLKIHWNLRFATSRQFFSLFPTLTSLRSLDLRGIEISIREPVDFIVESFPNSGKRQPISVLRLSHLCEGLAGDIIQCFLHPSAPVSIDHLSSLVIEDRWLEAATLGRLLDGQLEPCDLKNLGLCAVGDGLGGVENSFFNRWSEMHVSALGRLTQAETLKIFNISYTASCTWLSKALSSSSDIAESRTTEVVIVLGISPSFGDQILDLTHFETLKATLADGDKFARCPSLTVHVHDTTNGRSFENVMEDLREGMLTIPTFGRLSDVSDGPWMESSSDDDTPYYES